MMLVLGVASAAFAGTITQSPNYSGQTWAIGSSHTISWTSASLTVPGDTLVSLRTRRLERRPYVHPVRPSAERQRGLDRTSDGPDGRSSNGLPHDCERLRVFRRGEYSVAGHVQSCCGLHACFFSVESRACSGCCSRSHDCGSRCAASCDKFQNVDSDNNPIGSRLWRFFQGLFLLPRSHLIPHWLSQMNHLGPRECRRS